jgi:hypothetical protein
LVTHPPRFDGVVKAVERKMKVERYVVNIINNADIVNIIDIVDIVNITDIAAVLVISNLILNIH